MSSPVEDEIIIIPYNVLADPNWQENVPRLSKIINKSYDKPRYKYNIIQTSRIKDLKQLSENLLLKNGSFICLFLSKWLHRALYQGEVREFEPSLTGFDCDLPIEFPKPNFDASKIQIADSSFQMTEDVMHQIVGSVGVKPYLESIQAYEITAFTSFQYQTGSQFIRIIVELISQGGLLADICKNEGVIAGVDIHKPIQRLYASVVKEHNLVEYYYKLGFVVQDENSIRVNLSGAVENSTMEDGIKATKDFHITLLYKQIP